MTAPTPATPAPSFPASRYAVFALILVSALVWDLFTKQWVFGALGFPHRQSDWQWETPLLWGKFTITLFTSFNNGALWGLGQGHGWLFALLSVGASILVCYVLFVRGAARSLWLTVSLALIGQNRTITFQFTDKPQPPQPPAQTGDMASNSTGQQRGVVDPSISAALELLRGGIDPRALIPAPARPAAPPVPRP